MRVGWQKKKKSMKHRRRIKIVFPSVCVWQFRPDLKFEIPPEAIFCTPQGSVDEDIRCTDEGQALVDVLLQLPARKRFSLPNHLRILQNEELFSIEMLQEVRGKRRSPVCISLKRMKCEVNVKTRIIQFFRTTSFRIPGRFALYI